MKNNNVCFMLASSKTAIRPFVLLARQLNEQCGMKSIIICDKEVYQTYIQSEFAKNIYIFITFLSPEGHEYTDSIRSGNYDNSKVCLTEKTNRGFEHKDGVIISLYRVLWNTYTLYSMKRICKRVLKQYNPKAIVLYTDYRAGMEVVFSRIAKEMGIPTFIAPIVEFGPKELWLSNPNNFVRIEFNEKKHFLYRMIDKLYSYYVLQYNKQDVYFYHCYYFWALVIMRMLPPYPWLVGTNFCKKIGLMCGDDYEYYKKIKLNNKYFIDAVYMRSIEETEIINSFSKRKEIAMSIQQKYNLKGERIVCYALTGYSETNVSNCTREEVLSKYISILKILLQEYDDVLISMHPQIPKEDYKRFSSFPNTYILEEPFYEIVCALDVYIGFEISSIREYLKFFSYPQLHIKHDFFCLDWGKYEYQQIEDMIQKLNFCKAEDSCLTDSRPDFYQMLIKEIC